MKYKFTTNSRIISKIFANYKNTFIAFCELINNSIQAEATNINITIAQTPASTILSKPIINQIKIRDNGTGVSQSDFRKKILEIGTDVKTGGKGVGRFAFFQIGSFLEICTVAYDSKLKEKIETIFQLDGEIIKNNNLDEINLEVKHKKLKAQNTDSYYEATISNIYDEETIPEKRNKLHKNLFIENIQEAIFMQYPLQILNNEINFFINKIKINKKNFVIGDIETTTETYIDLSEIKHEIEFSFINYKSQKKDIKIFLRVKNNNIRTVAYSFNYNCDIPDTNGWLVYIDSKLFDDDQDIFRNLLISDIREDSKHLIKSLNSFIDNFFNEKFKDYFNFSKKLKNDSFYPYKRKKASSDSKIIVFNQLAYFVEKEHKILSDKNKIRKIIYSLMDKAINHGDLSPIIEQIVSLKNENITKFNELLEKTELEDVIYFSENVAQKAQTLDFLDEIIYGAPSKYIKERSQLHKIIERNIWLFGEQYNDSPILFSDKSLKNNLIKLRKKWFDYDLSEKDENLVELEDSNLRDITDLFFFNEKIMDNQDREVMIVELKRPICKISQKELSQLDRYRFDIEKNGKFTQEISFKIILISNDFTEFADSQIGIEDTSDPHLYKKSKRKNIKTYVIKWADLIHYNRKKISYLGIALRTKDIDIKKIFEKDYPNIEISDFFSTLTDIEN